MTAVAVVGVGAMGSRIARRLVEAEHDVVVWNRTPEKTEGFVPAATPADAAGRSELVIVMVSDPAALEHVTNGPGGIAAGIADSTLVVNMSTVGPDAVKRVADLLPSFLDAPVLGSLPEAEAGKLTIFVGGEATGLERALPVLEVLGSPIHVGGIGCGQAAKLIANFTLFGVLGIIGESLAAADALGLERAVTFEVLAATPIAAQAERRRPAIEAEEYPTRFALSLAHKDVDLLAAAVEGLDLRVLAAARSWLADASAAGRGAEDYSAMLAEILRATARASFPG